MKQIDYIFTGDYDRDFIEEELIDLFFVFDNSFDFPDQYTVYLEEGEVPELSEYSRSFVTSEKIEEINDDWKTKYKTSVKPFTHGHIHVRTPWGEPKEGYDNIIVNPALAFGTGDHETTIICSRNIIEYSGKKESMLDAGTGTGILCFIANKCGFETCLGFDIDDLAIESANENLALNDFNNGEVKLITASVDDEIITSGSYDLIVANMITKYLKMVVPTLISIMRNDTTLILSGILAEQEVDMIEFVETLGVVITGRDQLNEWVLLKVAKR